MGSKGEWVHVPCLSPSLSEVKRKMQDFVFNLHGKNAELDVNSTCHSLSFSSECIWSGDMMLIWCWYSVVDSVLERDKIESHIMQKGWWCVLRCWFSSCRNNRVVETWVRRHYKVVLSYFQFLVSSYICLFMPKPGLSSRHVANSSLSLQLSACVCLMNWWNVDNCWHVLLTKEK